MGFAVGQGEAVQALGVAGSKDLGDGAAGVVGDQVDIVEMKSIAAVGHEAGQAREREILMGGRRGSGHGAEGRWRRSGAVRRAG